jgi:hypothetical protein
VPSFGSIWVFIEPSHTVTKLSVSLCVFVRRFKLGSCILRVQREQKTAMRACG